MFDALFKTALYKREEKTLVEKSMYYLDLLGLSQKWNALVSSLAYGDQRRVGSGQGSRCGSTALAPGLTLRRDESG